MPINHQIGPGILRQERHNQSKEGRSRRHFGGGREAQRAPSLPLSGLEGIAIETSLLQQSRSPKTGTRERKREPYMAFIGIFKARKRSREASRLPAPSRIRCLLRVLASPFLRLRDQGIRSCAESTITRSTWGRSQRLKAVRHVDHHRSLPSKSPENVGLGNLTLSVADAHWPMMHFPLRNFCLGGVFCPI